MKSLILKLCGVTLPVWEFETVSSEKCMYTPKSTNILESSRTYLIKLCYHLAWSPRWSLWFLNVLWESIIKLKEVLQGPGLLEASRRLMSQLVGSIFLLFFLFWISLFLGIWGTPCLEWRPRDKSSHIHQGWENTRRFSQEHKLPRLEDREMKMHEKWKCMRLNCTNFQTRK